MNYKAGGESGHGRDLFIYLFILNTPMRAFEGLFLSTYDVSHVP